MATVTQDVSPSRSYSPFEGMSEARRLTTAVPRGMVRFFSDEAVDAKPINDDLVINITGSLPQNFAYIFNSISWNIIVDRAADFFDVMRFRIFNGLPNGTNGSQQVAMFNFTNLSPTAALIANQRVLEFSRGNVSDWYPNVLIPPAPSQAMSFTISAFNAEDAAQAAGTQSFSASFYQYELNQAVRFPLNSPLPVGIR